MDLKKLAETWRQLNLSRQQYETNQISLPEFFQKFDNCCIQLQVLIAQEAQKLEPPPVEISYVKSLITPSPGRPPIS